MHPHSSRATQSVLILFSVTPIWSQVDRGTQLQLQSEFGLQYIEFFFSLNGISADIPFMQMCTDVINIDV